MLHAILFIGLGFLLNFGVGTALVLYKRHKQYKELTNTATPKKLDKSKLCKSTHSWISTEMLTKTGVESVKVCKVCGFLSGTELMASQEAIDEIEETHMLKSIEKRMWDEFLNEEDEKLKGYLTQELADGLDFNKITAIHGAGISCTDRFKTYVLSKKEDIEKEVRRSN